MENPLGKSAKKLSMALVLLFAVLGLAGAGYYWHEEKNEPPMPLSYANVEELKAEVSRLESLKTEKGLAWQDTYRLGMAYLHINRTEDAAKTLKEAARLRPGFYNTYESLGMAYFRLGDFEKAKEVWHKALEARPSNAGHITDMTGRAEKRIGYKKRALEVERDIKERGATWKARFELATLYIGLGRLGDARRELLLAAKLNPESAELYDALAHLYATEGDFENAVKAERKALKLKPSDEAIKTRLSEMERLKRALKKGEFHTAGRKAGAVVPPPEP